MERELTLEESLGELLRKNCASVAVAESCTGGLVGARITDVAGSSEYFAGGIIAYSNEVKIRELGVSVELLAEHGAVSDPVARQMAEGVRKRFGSRYGIGVTGIAGPGGGSEAKPCGTVFIGLASADDVSVGRFVFEGDRTSVRIQSVIAALELLISICDKEGGRDGS